MSWFRYQMLISSILRYWKFCLRRDDLIDTAVHKYHYIKDCMKISSWVYKDLITIDAALIKIAGVWNKKLSCMKTVSKMHNSFRKIGGYSAHTKLRNFQY